MALAHFEWDPVKYLENQRKHNVSFAVIAEDLGHSAKENRYYCFGRVAQGVMTVRFTYRDGVIRIIGAGYWRKGKSIYERENKVYE